MAFTAGFDAGFVLKHDMKKLLAAICHFICSPTPEVCLI